MTYTRTRSLKLMLMSCHEPQATLARGWTHLRVHRDARPVPSGRVSVAGFVGDLGVRSGPGDGLGVRHRTDCARDPRSNSRGSWTVLARGSESEVISRS